MTDLEKRFFSKEHDTSIGADDERAGVICRVLKHGLSKNKDSSDCSPYIYRGLEGAYDSAAVDF